MTTPTEISAYLNVVAKPDDKRWSWRYVQTKGYWSIKYEGVLPPCELNLELNGSILCLQADLGIMRLKPECRPALHYFLLRLNDDLPIVKFGLNHENKITLMAEIPAAQLSLGAFEELLQVTLAVLVQYRHEIQLLASESTLAQLLLKQMDVTDNRAVPIRLIKEEQVH